MPEATQYAFKNRELLEMLIKQADIHDGRWVLSATFGFSVGNFGPTAQEMCPGGVVVLQAVGLIKAEESTPPEMMMDAATVNPKS